ncbi:MAG TPA: hypothetical protein VGD35_24455 [Chitinophaga sp.]
MHSKRPQSLKFYWLQYEVADIVNMMVTNPDLDYFVFPFYIPGDEEESGNGIQLIAYGYNREDSGDTYSSNRDILAVYKHNSLEVGGPLIMSNNIVSKAQMEAAIAPSSDGVTPDYLVLIPDVSETNFVYYKFRRHLRKPNAPDPQVPVPNGTVPVETNPSPPATMAPPAP